MRNGDGSVYEVTGNPVPFPLALLIEVFRAAATGARYDPTVTVDISCIELGMPLTTMRTFERERVFNKQMRASGKTRI